MTGQVDETTGDSRPGLLRVARQQLQLARDMVDELSLIRPSESALTGPLRALVDALDAIGRHFVYVDEDGESAWLAEGQTAPEEWTQAFLMDAVGPVLVAAYLEQIKALLELIGKYPSSPEPQLPFTLAVEPPTARDQSAFAALVDDRMADAIGFLSTISAQESPMNSELFAAAGDQLRVLRSIRGPFALWRQTLEASDRAEAAADAAAESAGETAEKSLAHEFEGLRDRERRAAELFRIATITLLLGVLGFSGWVAFANHAETDMEVWRKLALAIPALLLGAYLGREASEHRRTARWASVLVAQLKSIRAYSIELSELQREELKAVFGRRVFLESPDGTHPVAEPVPIDVVSVIREVGGLARASRGGS